MILHRGLKDLQKCRLKNKTVVSVSLVHYGPGFNLYGHYLMGRRCIRVAGGGYDILR